MSPHMTVYTAIQRFNSVRMIFPTHPLSSNDLGAGIVPLCTSQDPLRPSLALLRFTKCERTSMSAQAAGMQDKYTALSLPRHTFQVKSAFHVSKELIHLAQVSSEDTYASSTACDTNNFPLESGNLSLPLCWLLRPFQCVETFVRSYDTKTLHKLTNFENNLTYPTSYCSTFWSLLKLLWIPSDGGITLGSYNSFPDVMI